MINEARNSRRALVTGASRGIGAEIARCLFGAGYEVVLHAFSSVARARELAMEFEVSHHTSKVIQADLSSEDEIRDLIEQTGDIDVLVNNAALSQEKTFETITPEDYSKVLQVNLRAPFLLTQLVLPYMKSQNWGRVINISSIGGQWGGENQIHYAVAKAGLIGLTRSIAKTYSAFGITCNAISPGLVATDMSDAELRRPDGVRKLEQIPLGRVAQPAEVAEAVAFLASGKASYITGQTLNVNGGMLFS